MKKELIKNVICADPSQSWQSLVNFATNEKLRRSHCLPQPTDLRH